mmetsp:Transcript_81087/g.161204  ORF Transcript_81087/g.161204 Transcript_81087/m.161204 type:complete len:111 (+) Transcript_81087:1464-1796(+)
MEMCMEMALTCKAYAWRWLSRVAYSHIGGLGMPAIDGTSGLIGAQRSERSFTPSTLAHHVGHELTTHEGYPDHDSHSADGNLMSRVMCAEKRNGDGASPLVRSVALQILH